MRGKPAALFLLIGSSLLAGCARAPADRAMTPSRAPGDPMRALDTWVGVWKGSGWVMREDGARAEFTRVERVEPKVAGAVLLLEGEGAVAGDTSEARVARQGLAIVHYDDRAGSYRWSGHDAARGATDAELKPVEGGFEWTMHSEDLAASIRFTILVDDHRWREVGEVTTDGRSWNTFMEANLERQE